MCIKIKNKKIGQLAFKFNPVDSLVDHNIVRRGNAFLPILCGKGASPQNILVMNAASVHPLKNEQPTSHPVNTRLPVKPGEVFSLWDFTASRKWSGIQTLLHPSLQQQLCYSKIQRSASFVATLHYR